MADLGRRIVAVASRLVPRPLRREFRAEWEAELATDASFTRAAGAVPDAWFLFRQQWSPDMLTQDVRCAFRLLARRKTYTALVILTLAIAIGATTAVFSAIDAVLVRPLPYPEPSRLVTVWENDRLNRKPRYPVAPANWDDWRTQTQAFDNVAAYIDGGGAPLSAGGDPFRATVPVVSTNFFEVMGVRPMLGRTFARGDATPPGHRVLVLSFQAWQNHLGSDAGVIDRTVSFAEVPYRIVGVMPRGFEFPVRGADAWRPLAETPQTLQTRAQHFLDVIGRLKPGVSLAEARRDLEEVASRAQKQYPGTNDQRGTTIAPLQEAIAGDLRTPLLLLGGAVVILLIIGAVNVANLMLVEAAARRREIALRAAVGADRFRIFRQLIVEGLILALGGGALGVALAWGAVVVVARAAVDYVPRAYQIAIDGRVLAFALAVSAATGLVFALAPALLASRADVQHELREGARGAVGGSRRLRNTFVVVEFAAAVVLVIGAGLLLRSFWNIMRVQPGYASDHVLVASIELPRRYDTGPAITHFYSDLLMRLDGRPLISAAGLVNNLPVSGNAWTSWLTIENRPRPAGEPPEVGYRAASPGYFSALRIPILEGRSLADTDTPESMKVAVVNRALADKFFPNRSAVGARIRLGPNPNAAWREIVGVVGNIRHAGPETEPAPEVFLPMAQDVNGNMSLAVRGDGDTAILADAVRETVRAVDPGVTVWQMRPLDRMVDDHLAPRRLSLWLVQGFAAVALALALIGIYGVLSYTVTQRVPEIGVRMALGADARGIRRMVVRDGLRLALPALFAGTLAALLLTRLAQSMLFDVSPADPATYAAVIAASAAVAILACYLPARRASRVDPLTAIRSE
jgi:putative ABC transport system permease protein